MTLSRWPCLIHPSFVSQNRRGRDVKEPTLLSEEITGTFPRDVSTFHASRITHHTYHGLWVGYSKLIMVAAASGALDAEVKRVGGGRKGEDLLSSNP